MTAICLVYGAPAVMVYRQMVMIRINWLWCVLHFYGFCSTVGAVVVRRSYGNVRF